LIFLTWNKLKIFFWQKIIDLEKKCLEIAQVFLLDCNTEQTIGFVRQSSHQLLISKLSGIGNPGNVLKGQKWRMKLQ
jgi:hypothetical protein